MDKGPIDRVADALEKICYNIPGMYNRENLVDIAKQILTDLREPTEAMERAYEGWWEDATSRVVWQGMIDAALAD